MMIVRVFNMWRSVYPNQGLKGVLVYVFRALFLRVDRWLNSNNYPVEKRDVFQVYNFTLDGAIVGAENLKKSKQDDKIMINWVIPDFGIGSGGHLNIFRFIFHLEKLGYKCRVIIVGGSQYSTGDQAREIARKHFFLINAEFGIGENCLQPADFTFATSWITAYTVINYRHAGKYMYFVQDFEPFFYPHGSDYAFAEQTYRMGFYGVTAGGWLADKLSAEYGMKTMPVGFSYDRGLYFPRKRKKNDSKRVFFYARPVTPRRGFELGLLSLNLVSQRLPDVEFVLAGWDVTDYKIPFRHKNAGSLALGKLPELYSQCDVALVLSFTNLSLLPLELMACGCPVVSNRGANTEWLLNEQNSILADATPNALCEAIVMVLDDESLRNKLSAQGVSFVAGTNWEEEARKVANLLDPLQPAG
jgi:O-antigen biosynthesis protein